MKNSPLRRFSPILFAVMAIHAASARADDADPASFRSNEVQDRTVDVAAISTYRSSAQRLAMILKQKAGSKQEPELLMRLADIQHKGAAVAFRISGWKGDRSIHLTWLKQSLIPLDRMIQAYPRHPEIARAYTMRAKVRKETGDPNGAIADLKTLLENHPAKSNVVSSYILLHDLLVEQNDHAAAMDTLRRLAPKPTDPHYTMVLDRLALDYYALGDIPSAIAQIRAQLAAYQRRTSTTKLEIGERDRALEHALVFYATGTEKKSQEFNVEGAIPFFRGIAAPADAHRLVIEYAYLLRSKGLDAELDTLQKRAASEGLSKIDTAEITVVTLGHNLNRRRYSELKVAASALSAILADPKVLAADEARRDKIRAGLGDAAQTLQRYVSLAYKTAPDTPETTQMTYALIATYQALLKVPQKDPTEAVKITFNLAQACFNVRQFGAATLYYRWVSQNNREPAELVEEARFMRISARYEHLKNRKLLATEVVAGKSGEAKELHPEVDEWIGWLDDESSRKPREGLDAFLFEANRAIYAAGQTSKALPRLVDFTKRYPKSKQAAASAALAIDTYVVASQWETAHRLAQGFLASSAFQGGEFQNKLASIASDTAFRILELIHAKGNAQEAIDRAELYLKTYPESRHREECLSIGANSALALKDRKRAMDFYARMDSRKSTPETIAASLLTQAADAEENFDLDRASLRYRGYFQQVPAALRAKGADLKALRLKTLTLAWLTGRKQDLQAALAAPGVCADPTAEDSVDCGMFRTALATLEPAEIPDPATLASRPDSVRAAWALLSLAHPKAKGFEASFRILNRVEEGWEALDPILRYSLIGKRVHAYPGVLASARTHVRLKAPANRPDVPAIKRRIQAVEAMENRLNSSVKASFVGVRVALMKETGGLYGDLADDLAEATRSKAIKADEREMIVAALEEIRRTMETKAVQLRKAAFVAASEAGIENSVFEPVLRDYLKALPTEAQALAAGRTQLAPDPQDLRLGVSYLEALDPKAGWGEYAATAETDQLPGTRLRRAWVNSLKERNWPRVAFLLQAARDRKLLPDNVLAGATAVSLEAVGVRAEGLVLLDSSAPSLWRKSNVFFSTWSRAKTRDALESLGSKGSAAAIQLRGSSGAGFYLDAVAWSQADVPGASLHQARAAFGVDRRVPATEDGEDP